MLAPTRGVGRALAALGRSRPGECQAAHPPTANILPHAKPPHPKKLPSPPFVGFFATSGRPDLNPGPPAPEAGALTGLRYAPFLQKS